MTVTLDARTLMEHLIAFPTVSRDSNLQLIDFVEGYLRDHGIASTRVPDPTGEKAALYAHVGPEVDGAIILSGHSDVVPVDGQAWVTDPFNLVEKDGKYFGRGTCDMKGFDAMAIWALVEAKKRGVNRPLQLALSYDEEVGCTGAPAMIDAMVASGMARASAAIIGEPSMMKVVTGHKGGIGFNVHVRGFEVHSSLLHTGVNAVMFGAKLIDWCNEMNAANAAKAPAPMDTGFVPPYTTVHVGMVSGGTAHNITAKDCHFVLTFRAVPSEPMQIWVDAFEAKVAGIAAQMQAIHPDTGIDYTPKFDVPGLKPEVEGEAEQIVRLLTGDNAVNVVSYATEAGQFQERGYSAVICGPGDIAQAHQPNEFITLEQFKAGEAFMERLLDSLA